MEEKALFAGYIQSLGELGQKCCKKREAKSTHLKVHV